MPSRACIGFLPAQGGGQCQGNYEGSSSLAYVSFCAPLFPSLALLYATGVSAIGEGGRAKVGTYKGGEFFTTKSLALVEILAVCWGQVCSDSGKTRGY